MLRDFRSPGQHDAAAAGLVVEAFQGEVLEQGAAAAGADGQGAEFLGVFHDGVLGGIGAQALVACGAIAGLGDSDLEQGAGLFQNYSASALIRR